MIVLNENFYIETDTFNYTLQFRKDKQVEKSAEIKTITQSETWYYPNIQACCRKYLDESLKESESIEEVLLKIEGIHQTIKNIKL